MCLLWECAQAPPKSQSHAMWSRHDWPLHAFEEERESLAGDGETSFLLTAFLPGPPQKTYICQRVSLSLTIFLTTSLAAAWAPTGDRE